MAATEFDALEELFNGEKRETPRESSKPLMHVERCTRCNGSGRYSTFGGCFACSGKGSKFFKTSAATRAKSRDKAAAKKAAYWPQFVIDSPELARWIETNQNRSSWAARMREAVVQYGSLTDNQIAAIRKIIAADADRAVETQARVAAAPSISADKIAASLNKAKLSGIKRPYLHLGDFTFSFASATSANAGAIYVKAGDDYLGKIVDGKFLDTRACGEARKAQVLECAADPKAAAKAYGFRTGRCSCCGRQLTNHASIELGIGPICAERFF